MSRWQPAAAIPPTSLRGRPTSVADSTCSQNVKTVAWIGTVGALRSEVKEEDRREAPDRGHERSRAPAGPIQRGRTDRPSRSLLEAWLRWAQCGLCCSASRASSAASVSASCSGLSSRMRSMRGKRTAMPLLWRGAAVDALEAELEHQRRPDAAHRAELLERGAADDASTCAELLVGQARVGLGEGTSCSALGCAGSLRGDRLDHRVAPRPRRAACGSRPRRCSRCRRWRAGRGRPARRRARSRRVSGSIFHFHQVPPARSSCLRRPVP